MLVIPASDGYGFDDCLSANRACGHVIADAWCEITGDRKEDVAIFLHEVPGANVLEDGVILPESADDPGAIT